MFSYRAINSLYRVLVQQEVSQYGIRAAICRSIKIRAQVISERAAGNRCGSAGHRIFMPPIAVNRKVKIILAAYQGDIQLKFRSIKPGELLGRNGHRVALSSGRGVPYHIQAVRNE